MTRTAADGGTPLLPEDYLAKLAEMVAEAQRAARRDTKTPLQNEHALRARMQQAHASGEDVALIYGDINGLKAINDGQSHDAGDATIARVGRQIAEVLEPFPVDCFREGGDEFVLITPIVHLDAVTSALARAFVRVDVKHDETIFHVSMSFGWASRSAATSAAQWKERAEAAAVAAKQSGPGVVLEWTGSLRAEEIFRLRCDCGCSFTARVSSGTVRSPNDLHCPVCGRRRTPEGSALSS